MVYLYIILICFLLLYSLPFIVAFVYYKKRQSKVLFINQNYVRDPRYFSKSFAAMVEKRLPEAKDNIIKLSREEEYVDDEKLKSETGIVTKMVLTFNNINPDKNISEFEKEIYCGKDGIISNDKTELRAIYCKNNLILGNNVTVDRWADAGSSLSIYDHCDLGINASAATQMCVGYDCTFQRLYSPIINIGQRPDNLKKSIREADDPIYYMSPFDEKERNIRYISKERIDEDGVIRYTVLSWRNVTLNEDIVICGHIRSHKGVRICENAVVIGNIFAEDDIRLDKNALVLGNIFCQGSIYFEEGAAVGQKGKISSVIARDHVVFKGNNTVYGYVGCEHGGRIKKSKEVIETTDFKFLQNIRESGELRFNSVEDYENVSKKGFRKNSTISYAQVPYGATLISKSLFYNCENLKKVEIPTTIEEIKDFAFGDCYKLTDIGDLSSTKVKSIGTSAFEGDVGLVEITFPKTLTELKGAAFQNCTNLKSVTIPEDSCLEVIGNHCFHGAKSLETLYIPDSVRIVGISCFMECDNLKELSIPEHLSTQPGIKEISEILPDVKVSIRAEEKEE